MNRPSGDHTASATPIWKSVSCRGSPPSTGITKSWVSPARSDSKIKRLPSGEKVGLESWCRPWVICRGLLPCAPIIQISDQLSPFSSSYRVTATATRSPSALIAGAPTNAVR
jgi:hypothetical protein